MLARSDIAVLTLTGPGGSGKTRLALEAARDAASDFPGGVYLVDLAPLSNPADVPVAVARVLRLGDTSGSLTDSIKRRLRGEEPALVVLDNFEHLLPAASFAADLCLSCANLTLLITSRSPLRITGEQEMPIAPLPVPPRQGSVPTASLLDFPSVQLFFDRALAVDPTFTLDGPEAALVGEICRRLDGLPLAIELASTRVKVLSPEALLDRLDTRLSLLKGGPRDLPARQQTMRDTIAWSYALLSEDEQAVFRAASITVGSSTLACLEAVCSGHVDPSDVFDLVSSLVEKNLLVHRSSAGEPLFGMLETMREFGIEQALAHGELGQLRESLAVYAMSLCQDAAPHLASGRRLAWIERIRLEHDNLREALRWCVEQDRGDIALEIVGALWMWYRLHFAEGRQWTQSVLELPSAQGDSPSRAKALFAATVSASGMGDLAAVHKYSEENIALSRRLDDPERLVYALSLLGGSADHTLEQISDIYREAYAIAARLGDEWLTAKLFMNEAMAALRISMPAEAVGPAREAVARYHELGDEWMEAVSALHLGVALVQLGQYNEARDHLEASIPGFAALRDSGFMVMSLLGLAVISAKRGELREAAQMFHRAVQLCGETGDRGHLPIALDGLATVALAEGHGSMCLELLDASTALRLSGARPAMIWFSHWAREVTAPIRARMPATARSSRTEHPEDLELVLVRSLALASDIATPLAAGARTGPSLPAGPSGELSPREREVLQLIAAGASNREIADTLVLSVRTVEKHTASIYGKTGLRGRAEAAAFAVRHGLAVDP
jgi:predicted ATPase/DNA-binding CsgD family transcriptional regulator